METIARKRCANHGAREAAARCPRCGRCFCRECVTEHDGRLVCAACLAALARAASPGRRRLFAGAGVAARLALGLALAWLFFHLCGRALLAVPSSFHEGTVWEQAVTRR